MKIKREYKKIKNSSQFLCLFGWRFCSSYSRSMQNAASHKHTIRWIFRGFCFGWRYAAPMGPRDRWFCMFELSEIWIYDNMKIIKQRRGRIQENRGAMGERRTRLVVERNEMKWNWNCWKRQIWDINYKMIFFPLNFFDSAFDSSAYHKYTLHFLFNIIFVIISLAFLIFSRALCCKEYKDLNITKDDITISYYKYRISAASCSSCSSPANVFLIVSHLAVILHKVKTLIVNLPVLLFTVDFIIFVIPVVAISDSLVITACSWLISVPSGLFCHWHSRQKTSQVPPGNAISSSSASPFPSLCQFQSQHSAAAFGWAGVQLRHRKYFIKWYTMSNSPHRVLSGSPPRHYRPQQSSAKNLPPYMEIQVNKKSNIIIISERFEQKEFNFLFFIT